MAHRGDKVIICTYCSLNEKEADAHKPRIILLDEENRINQIL